MGAAPGRCRLTLTLQRRMAYLTLNDCKDFTKVEPLRGIVTVAVQFVRSEHL